MAPFQFQPTLDGEVYNAAVVWLFGMAQRWYLQLYSLSGNLVFLQALIGSPSGFNIEAMSWSNGAVTITTAGFHDYLPLSTIDLTVAGAAPSVFNGVQRMFVVDRQTLTFMLSADPGSPTVLGRVSYDINMGESYFEDSTLVYRESTQQFEVTP